MFGKSLEFTLSKCTSYTKRFSEMENLDNWLKERQVTQPVRRVQLNEQLFRGIFAILKSEFLPFCPQVLFYLNHLLFAGTSINFTRQNFWWQFYFMLSSLVRCNVPFQIQQLILQDRQIKMFYSCLVFVSKCLKMSNT